MSKSTRLANARKIIAEYEATQASKKGKAKDKGVRVLSNGVRQDIKTGKFLSGPAKGTKVTSTRGKVRKTRTGTSQKVRTAPKKGQTLFLTQDSRQAFLAAAKKDGYDLRAQGVVSTIQIVVASVLGKKGLPKGYAPKGFKVGERYTAKANGLTKAEVKAILNRA